MKQRCYNENHQQYKNYGGRGITICENWLGNYKGFKNDMFESFLAHVDQFGLENTQIEREDNNKGYSLDNCKWATRIEQSNNRSSNTICEYKGEKYTIAELSRLSGKSQGVIRTRIKKFGYSVEDAVEQPLYKIKGERTSGKITYNRKVSEVVELCQKHNISPSAFHRRLKRGWTVERALNEPLKPQNNKGDKAK